MSSPEIVIRPARSGEAAALTALCVRAKAHWGYDAAFMAAAARLLQIREEAIGAGSVLTARLGPAAALPPCGVAMILRQRRSGWFELSHLFVAPERLRCGVGRALFHATVDLAAARGGRRVLILSDPNAAAFYQKLGARHCGAAPSEVDRSRMLPLFEYAIPTSRSEAPQPPG